MTALSKKFGIISKRYFIPIIILFALFISINQIFFPNSYVFGLILVILFFLFALMYPRKSFHILLMTSIVFLEGSGAFKYFSFNFGGFYIRAFEVFLLAYIIAWLVNLARHKINFNFDRSKTGIFLILFLLWSLFSFIYGFYSNAKITDLVNDSRQLLGYLAFFFVLSVIINTKQILSLKRTIIYSSLIFSIVFIILFYFRSFIVHYTGFEFGEFGERFAFRNNAILFFPLTYLFYSIFSEKVSRQKILNVVIFLPIFFAALLSENRTLWISLLVIFPLIIIYLLIRRKIRIASFLIVVAILVFLILVISQLTIITDSDFYISITKRVETFTKLYRDPSLVFRLEVYTQAFEGILDKPVIGEGFGTPVKIEHAGNIEEIPYVDNSYLTLAFKTGLIGLTLYLLFFIFALISLFKSTYRTRKKSIKQFFTQNIFALIGLLFFSLSTVILFNYQVIFLIATLFGIFERYYLMKIKPNA